MYCRIEAYDTPLGLHVHAVILDDRGQTEPFEPVLNRSANETFWTRTSTPADQLQQIATVVNDLAYKSVPLE